MTTVAAIPSNPAGLGEAILVRRLTGFAVDRRAIGLSRRKAPTFEMWRHRLRRSLAQGSGALTVLALLTGVGAGAGAVGFRYLILGFTYVFTGHRDYSAVGHAPNSLVPGLGMWFVVAAPVLGGLIYGPLVARFAPEARGHGVPEVMLAVNRPGDGSGRRYQW